MCKLNKSLYGLSNHLRHGLKGSPISSKDKVINRGKLNVHKTLSLEKNFYPYSLW